MSDLISKTLTPNTTDSLLRAFRQLGVTRGDTLLIHSSMSALGWTIGGAQAIVQALLSAVGDTGTLMMPTHTPNNTDPSEWINPPIPREWWPLVREFTPAFDPIFTPSSSMGAVVETFRCGVGVCRSHHPTVSFAAHGPQADFLTQHHELESQLGEASPLARLYDLDGKVLLLGVNHLNNTSLHLSEHRANIPHFYSSQGSAMWVEGQRQWVTYSTLVLDSDDFDALGQAFERDQPQHITIGSVGMGTARLMSQRTLVDYGVRWLEHHRV